MLTRRGLRPAVGRKAKRFYSLIIEVRPAEADAETCSYSLTKRAQASQAHSTCPPQNNSDTRRFAGCLLLFVQRRRDTEARQGVRAAGLHVDRSPRPPPARKNPASQREICLTSK